MSSGNEKNSWKLNRQRKKEMLEPPLKSRLSYCYAPPRKWDGIKRHMSVRLSVCSIPVAHNGGFLELWYNRTLIANHML